jgi:hypothetical protein
MLDFIAELFVDILENTWMIFKLFLSLAITLGLIAIPVYLIIITDSCWPMLLFIPFFGIGYTFHEILCN